MYKQTTNQKAEYCSFERLERLKQAGIKTDGYINELKQIIENNGNGLPTAHEGAFGFILQSYTVICLELVDAMAEEILLLHKLNLLKQQTN